MTAVAHLPVDQADRDAIRTDVDATLLVDAGAGTGKTSELVERITGLLRTGRAEIRSLAAITFTEAAAAELRHRVRDRLETLAATEGDPAGRIGAALAGMDDAAFTTLHAFAQRLLAEHPLEAGLPPRVEILPEAEEHAAFERRWDRFLGELLDDPAAAGLVRRASDLGFRVGALREVAQGLSDDLERVGLLAAGQDLPVPDTARLRAALADALALRARCTDAADGLAAHLDGPVSVLAQGLAAPGDADDVVRLLVDAPSLTSSRGNQASWNGDKPQVAAALRRAEAERAALVGAQCDAVGRALGSRLAGFVTAWGEERRQEGRLRFHDLLVGARGLLAGSAGVRAGLRRRWTHLLIDEFQDTDPLQIELAVLLASGDHDAARDWAAAALDPGRLFVVGDPTQSIYRFRRADVAVYDRARRHLPVQARSLTQNFRCVPGVVDWVNAVFTALIGPGVPGGQPPYRPLTAQRDPVGDAPAVRRFGGPSDGSSAEVRVQEADDVAAVVGRVLAERWPVLDWRTGEVRAARRADIAVLVRRHRTVRLLERALEDAGLPYRIESRSLIWATDEVRDLVTILQAVEDPADEVAVVAALRHPAFACDDRALLDWRARGGGWRPTRPDPDGVPDDHPVAVALARLRALHEGRHRFSVGGLVEHLVADLRLVELAFAHRRPRDRWRRLRFLADQAHAFHDDGGDLRGFLRWAAQQAARDVRVDEFVVDEPDDDAVRITTIHGAKGLEYPIVVLLGLDVDRKRLPGQPRVLWDGPAGVELSLGGALKTAGFDRARKREVELHAHEEARLLYVGATRARDHLVVSLHHRDGTDCHARELLALEGLDAAWAEIDPDPVSGADPVPVPAPAPDPAEDAAPAELAAWRAGRDAQRRAAPARVLAATAIAEALAPPPPTRRVPATPPPPRPPSFPRPPGPAALPVRAAEAPATDEPGAAPRRGRGGSRDRRASCRRPGRRRSGRGRRGRRDGAGPGGAWRAGDRGPRPAGGRRGARARAWRRPRASPIARTWSPPWPAARWPPPPCAPPRPGGTGAKSTSARRWRARSSRATSTCSRRRTATWSSWTTRPTRWRGGPLRRPPRGTAPRPPRTPSRWRPPPAARCGAACSCSPRCPRRSRWCWRATPWPPSVGGSVTTCAPPYPRPSLESRCPRPTAPRDHVARRPRLTFRRVPRLAAAVPADRAAEVVGGSRDHPPAPGSAEALRALRSHIRRSVDHRLRCRICRRPAVPAPLPRRGAPGAPAARGRPRLQPRAPPPPAPAATPAPLPPTP